MLKGISCEQVKKIVHFKNKSLVPYVECFGPLLLGGGCSAQ